MCLCVCLSVRPSIPVYISVSVCLSPSTPLRSLVLGHKVLSDPGRLFLPTPCPLAKCQELRHGPCRSPELVLRLCSCSRGSQELWDTTRLERIQGPAGLMRSLYAGQSRPREAVETKRLSCRQERVRQGQGRKFLKPPNYPALALALALPQPQPQPRAPASGSLLEPCRSLQQRLAQEQPFCLPSLLGSRKGSWCY